MKKINVQIVSDQELRQATEKSVGFDIKAIEEPTFSGREVAGKPGYYHSLNYIEYNTGVKVKPEDTNNEDDYYTLLLPRSSVSKYNLVLANSVGLIDTDYTGNLIFRFKYLFQPEDLEILSERIFNPASFCETTPKFKQSIIGSINFEKIYKKGDFIGQLMFGKTIQSEFDKVLFLAETKRGAGAFGHSDTK